MPDIADMFPSKFLKCADLDGREITVTIKEVKVESVGQTRDSKPVAYFRGAGKGLILNRTNSKRIAAIAGSTNTDDWVGQRIVLFPAETEFAGEVVECVRVKSPAAAKKKSEPEPTKPTVKTKAAKAAKPVEPEPDDPIPATMREPGDEVDERDVDPDDEDVIPF